MKRVGFVLLVVAIFLVGGLFISTNLLQVIVKRDPNVHFRPDHIKGIAIVSKGIPYTLNFEQQNSLIAEINQMSEVNQMKREEKNNDLPFEKIIVYTFSDSDVELTGTILHENRLVLTYTLNGKRQRLKTDKIGEFMQLIKQATRP